MKVVKIIGAVVIGFLLLAVLGSIIGPPTKNETQKVVVEKKEKPVRKYVTDSLPKGIVLYGFEEKFNKPYGQYELLFQIRNLTGSRVEYPQIDADLYVDGELVGTVTGGPGKHLNNEETGTISHAYILPEKVPDSLIFKFIQ